MSDGISLAVLAILALLFPPAVPLMLDGCGGQIWLNLLFCILGWVPGIIHAFWLIHRGPKRARRQEPNIVYVEGAPGYPPQPRHQFNGQQGYKR